MADNLELHWVDKMQFMKDDQEGSLEGSKSGCEEGTSDGMYVGCQVGKYDGQTVGIVEGRREG